jgi:hypothetical protein
MKKSPSYFFWFFLVLLFVFVISFHSAERDWSQDLGRHLKLGEIILGQKSIPDINLFSFTYKDFPFYNHHWLSEVVFAVIYSTFGNNGLILLKVIFFVLAWGGIFWLFSQKVSPSWLAFLSLLPILVFRERTGVRPEIFGILFFSLFLIILAWARKGKKELLWWLPILQFLWVNLHISFVFGLFLIGVNFVWWWQKKSINFSKEGKKIILPFVLTFLVNLLNPNFIKGALAPFLIWQNYGYQISENQSIFFLAGFGYQANIVFFKVGLLFGLLLFVFAFDKKELVDFFSWLVISIISAIQIRHFPFWALYSFWFWGKISFSFFKKISLKLKTYLNWLAGKVTLLVVLFLIFTYSTGLIYRWSDSERNFGFGGEQPAREAVLFLVDNFSQERVFNNFDIGSYLDFFYPKIKVFIDSRPEAYPTEFWEEYRQIQFNWDRWQEAAEKYNLKVVFFSHTDQTPWAENFLEVLYLDKNWRLVYLDENIVIFTNKIDGAPAELIINKNFLDSFAGNALGLIKLGRFFHLIGEEELFRLSLEKALEANPDSYFANLNLAKIYFQSDNLALRFRGDNLIGKISHWWYKL